MRFYYLSIMNKLQICSLNLHLISFFRQLFILFGFRPCSPSPPT